jgi:hypothetical protein
VIGAVISDSDVLNGASGGVFCSFFICHGSFSYLSTAGFSFMSGAAVEF